MGLAVVRLENAASPFLHTDSLGASCGDASGLQSPVLAGTTQLRTTPGVLRTSRDGELDHFLLTEQAGSRRGQTTSQTSRGCTIRASNQTVLVLVDQQGQRRSPLASDSRAQTSQVLASPLPVAGELPRSSVGVSSSLLPTGVSLPLPLPVRQLVNSTSLLVVAVAVGFGLFSLLAVYMALSPWLLGKLPMLALSLGSVAIRQHSSSTPRSQASAERTDVVKSKIQSGFLGIRGVGCAL